jgi:hypothetical protein
MVRNGLIGLGQWAVVGLGARYNDTSVLTQGRELTLAAEELSGSHDGLGSLTLLALITNYMIIFRGD